MTILFITLQVYSSDASVRNEAYSLREVHRYLQVVRDGSGRSERTLREEQGRLTLFFLTKNTVTELMKTWLWCYLL